MNVRLTMAVCILIASAVVFLVVRFVRVSNRRLSGADANARNWHDEACDAHHTAAEARQQTAYSTRLASDAVARTGQALEVAREIRVVREQMEVYGGQMDVLMSIVLGEHTAPLPPPRHALPPDEPPAIPGELAHLPEGGRETRAPSDKDAGLSVCPGGGTLTVAPTVYFRCDTW